MKVLAGPVRFIVKASICDFADCTEVHRSFEKCEQKNKSSLNYHHTGKLSFLVYLLKFVLVLCKRIKGK